MRGFAVPADARVFLGRLTRLDPDALVRLRPAGPGRTGLWARLPWGVLVAREVEGEITGDQTFGAAALLAGESGGQRRDPEWRWPLPPHAGTVLEEIPARRLRAVAEAAAGTLREVSAAGLGGRTVGSRVLREALLDHVPIVVVADGAGRPDGAGDSDAGKTDAAGVTDDAAGAEAVAVAGERIEVPQRLVQGVVQMGFLGSAGTTVDTGVRVRRAQRWTGLAARYGSAWLAPAPLVVRPVRSAPAR